MFIYICIGVYLFIGERANKFIQIDLNPPEQWTFDACEVNKYENINKQYCNIEIENSICYEKYFVSYCKFVC
jgi:hypothetical protein